MEEKKSYAFQYSEHWDGRSGITFGIEQVLFSRQSDFQKVEVLQTDAFGRLMTLDGLVMLTERDEFVYHEMISHPSLCLLRTPKRALVIGGGDGGTVREILRHASIEQVDLVEIDGMVIDAAREFFPQVCSGFGDPRLDIRVEDGVAFVKEAPADFYDLVIVDSTDPVDFAEGLFGAAFYRDCLRILTERGILVTQSESPFDRHFRTTLRKAHEGLSQLFEQVHVYIASIPTYPLGLWSFMMATRGLHPLHDFDMAAAQEQVAPFADQLSYYNPELHRGAFALPSFAKRLFE